MSLFERIINQITFANFNRVRRSFALAFLLFGSAVVYFFRDGLGIAPGSTAFTGAFLFMSLILMFPVSFPQRLYMPNKLLGFFSVTFLFIAVAYMLTYAPNRGWFTNTQKELVYYSLIFTCFVLLSTISANDLEPTFLRIVIWLSIIGCVGLIYILLKNPLYVMGGRASIKLGTEDNSTDNPHIFAKNALFGLFALLAMYRTKQPMSKLFIYGSTIFFIVVLFLTQSMSTILSLVLALGATFVLTFSIHSIVGFFNMLLQPRFWMYYLLALLPLSYVLFFTNIKPYVALFTEVVFNRVWRIVNTIMGEANEADYRTIDYSSSGRLETLNEFFERAALNWENGNIWPLLFGNGYQDFFFDNPILESYHDLGILGFIAFFGWQIYSLYLAIKEIRNPTNGLVLFIAYSVLYVLMHNTTGGMPYDYLRWTMMAFITRFMIRRYYKRTPTSPAPTVPS